MLGSFLYNVLRDNQNLIRKFEETAENTNNMEQAVRCKDQATNFVHNGAECIQKFLKFSILTNTYEEARGWLDQNKDEFSEEIDIVADSLIRSSERVN